MIKTMLATAAAVLAFAPSHLAAQEPRQLIGLEAQRTLPNQVEISFSYEGSACEEVGPAQRGDLNSGTLAIAFPTIDTAEVCTLQIVQIEVNQTIEANDMVEAVEVTLLAPDGGIIAMGTTAVDG
ncbi:hypothetical protein [Devosia sp. RR2S18]|uniref:hypothetical protein n=1 Tax=Devosia rhizosphaerae TaxID=3049774 RepID=UPI002541B52E|nr:hypothetical protein [Devosia sp. RR2S18]WIJ24171.1 hypothetical protein QOV41_14265 [Devosia sp. RR2S18]